MFVNISYVNLSSYAGNCHLMKECALVIDGECVVVMGSFIAVGLSVLGKSWMPFSSSRERAAHPHIH